MLRPGGRLGLLWNLLDDEVPWVAAVADAFDAEDRASVTGNLEVPVGEVAALAEPSTERFRHLHATDAEGLDRERGLAQHLDRGRRSAPA